MSTAAKVIKIVSLPHGDAPDWVLNSWIGCIMPCEPECEHMPAEVESVLQPKRPSGLLKVDEFIRQQAEALRKIAGYSVDTTIALDILRKKSPTAAKWFYDHGFPIEGKAFRFKAKEVQVVGFVRDDEDGPVVRHDDMETGSMRPLT